MRRNIVVAACLLALLSGVAINNADAFVPSPMAHCLSSSSLLPMNDARRRTRSHDTRSSSRQKRRVSRAAAAAAANDDDVDVISPDDYDLLPPSDEEEDAIVGNHRADQLKRRLLSIAASYDRGFGATTSARKSVDDIIRELRLYNPTKEGASKGIDGYSDDGDDVPLRAIWRMIWTSAFDVVSLASSPLAAPSAIYQDIRNPPVAINIIDFIPRSQTLLPLSISPPSLLRAKVATRASSRANISNRIGLSFEGLELQPIELLGRRVDGLPPLSVDFTWPGTLLRELAALLPGLDRDNLGITSGGVDGVGKRTNDDAPGYFDVEYLDEEMLIIRQQAPGGVFVLVKVDSCDP